MECNGVALSSWEKLFVYDENNGFFIILWASSKNLKVPENV